MCLVFLRRCCSLLVPGALSVAFVSTVALAQARGESDEFEQLRKEYSSLRNTDLAHRRISEWRALALKTERFASRARNSRSGAQAYFNTSVLYEEIFRTSGNPDDAHKALNSLQLLRTHFPSDMLVDDSLFRSGMLSLKLLNDRDAARIFFAQVLSQFPKSDQSALAEIELSRLQRELSAVPDRTSAEAVPTPAPGATTTAVVVLDPGHGGEDFGAVGSGGLLEKDIVLEIALALERKLQERLHAKVFLTRRKDEFVPLAVRTELANQHSANLFLSLHVNASPRGNIFGFEFYHLDNSGDEATRLLAERENGSAAFPGTGSSDLAFMLSDLIQGGKDKESIRLAQTLERQLVPRMRALYPKAMSRGVRKAPFYVLVGAHMPCVLVELLSVDHREEGQLLALKEFRELLAEGLFDGISSYLQKPTGRE